MGVAQAIAVVRCEAAPDPVACHPDIQVSHGVRGSDDPAAVVGGVTRTDEIDHGIAPGCSLVAHGPEEHNLNDENMLLKISIIRFYLY